VKLAVCFARDAGTRAPTARRMLEAQRLRDHQRPEVFEVEDGALGWLTTFEQATAVQLARRAPSGNVLLVSGVPVNLEGSLDELLAAVLDGDYRLAARVLPTLDGAFAIVHWDASSRKLVVVTDFLGMQPLYEVEAGDGLVLATELKGAAASAGFHVAMDPLGWGMLAALGHFAEDATSLKGVRRMSESTVLIYDAVTGRRDESSYWRWPRARPGLTLAEVDTAVLLAGFRRHLLAYRAHRADATVLLSGGFDSRLIAATLVRAGARPQGLVLSHPDEQDDADGYLAIRLAKTLGLDYGLVPAAPGFYSSSAYIDYLIMSEVATTSFGLFIAQLASSIAGRANAVWEGVAPNYALRTPHQQEGGFEPFFRGQTDAFNPSVWRALRSVFAPEIADGMEEGFRQCMGRTQARYPDDGFGVAEFITRSRMRNRTGPNPLKVYANDLLPFTPGLSKEFWGLTAGLSYEIKANCRLSLEVFRRHFAELARLSFCSEGILHKGRQGLDLGYTLLRFRGRFMDHYYVARAARRLHLRPSTAGGDSLLLKRTLQRVDAGHPDLRADIVATLLRVGGDADPVTQTAHRWLFYWQMWRWIMEGEILARRAELVGEAPAA
jgi:asparagine synthase (glutamine-hydrolysing)